MDRDCCRLSARNTEKVLLLVGDQWNSDCLWLSGDLEKVLPLAGDQRNTHGRRFSMRIVKTA